METQRARISSSAMAEVRDAMKDYCNAVMTSELTLNSQSVYIDHVNAFMRWLRYEFEPGSRTGPRVHTKDKPKAAYDSLREPEKE